MGAGRLGNMMKDAGVPSGIGGPMSLMPRVKLRSGLVGEADELASDDRGMDEAAEVSDKAEVAREEALDVKTWWQTNY